MTPKSQTHLPELKAPAATPMTALRVLRSLFVMPTRRPTGGDDQFAASIPGRRRPFLLLLALACMGMPAWSGTLKPARLDPEVIAPAPRPCFLCSHEGFDYEEPGGDEPRQSRPEPEPQPEPEVCE